MFEVNNCLARSNGEKFYLDSGTADVKFVYGTGTDNVEIIPAHKIILSIDSPVFDAMFYGSLPELGDIPINEASPAVFKEFLQFFYLTKVRLTCENIADVANLCKMYEVKNGLRLCEGPLQRSLTIDDFCSGYELATLLELPNMLRFCEQKIIQNAENILVSASFLECNSDTLDKILQLLTINGIASICNAWRIVDACLAWAEAECGRKELEKSTANLRAQLGQSFGRIPFVELNKIEFEQFTTAHNEFFNETEKATIISKINEFEGELDSADFDEIDDFEDFDAFQDFDQVDYFV